MRTPLGPSRTSRSLHQTASTSDIPVVTRRHTRPISLSTDVLSDISSPLLRMVPCLSIWRDTRFDLRARGPCYDLTVRPVRTAIQERLLSSQYFASDSCETREPNLTNDDLIKDRPGDSHTVSPFLGPCPRQAVLRASLRLAPYISMTENKTRDVSDRLLPLERLTCTRTSCVPSSLSRLSPGGYPVESWAPRNLLGKQVFHDT